MNLEKFIIKTLSTEHYQLLFNYYNYNKHHLEPWEPKRNKNYYSLDFHINRTNDRLNLINNKKSMHFVLLNNYKTKIIGVCNYTHIEKEECWLGYSISRDYQGKGFMFKALKYTNKFMFNNFKINTINAGIMKTNIRSIKLINRLSFKKTDNYDELEINGNIKKLYIHQLNKQNAIKDTNIKKL